MQIVVKNLLKTDLYFSTFSQRLRNSKTATNTAQNAMDNDVFQAYRQKVQKSSILRQFRQQVFRRSELNSDWQTVQRKQQQQQQKLQKLLNKQSQDGILKNASKMEARLTSKRNLFHENDSRSLLSDYGDYTAYNKVYPVLEDRNLGDGQYLQNQSINKNLYAFLDKLPDNYQQKIQIKRQISRLSVADQNITLAQYGQKLQDFINQTKNNQSLQFQSDRIHKANKQIHSPIEQDQQQAQEYHPFTGTKKTIDPWNHQENIEATLSPRAIDTIYELYLQGWTIRDISKRFGILPARAKFCIWIRAQLYHEIIPKLGLKFYLKAIKFEQKFNQEQKFCDYGLDLEQLNNDNIVGQIHQWNGQMLDAQRKQDEYQAAMFKLEQKKKFNKYELVTVGTHGKENAMYLLKQWVVFRGKGSDQYFLKNKVFRKLSKAQRKFSKVYY